MRRGKRHRLLGLGILVGVGLSSAVACAIAAPIGQVPTSQSRLPVDQTSSFNKALITLAAQGHVAIVAEGVPLHPLSSSQDAEIFSTVRLDAKIQAIAAACDYTAQREGNVFILTKRYSDPDDLPAITQAECINALEQMQKVAAPFNPHVPPNSLRSLTTATQDLSRSQYQIISPLLDPLAALLTTDQLGEMAKNNLYYSSLTPQEQQAARRVLLYLYVQQTMEATSPVPTQIKRAEQAAVFGWADTSSARHTFGYVLPKVPTEPMAASFHPLSEANSLDDLNITVIAPPAASASGTDPTAPNPASVPATGGMTLADAIMTLNAQSKSIQAEVNPAVAAKPVMFAGLNNVSALQALQALADMYGLRLTTSSLNNQPHFLLTLPLVEPPASISALPAALRECLPKPFMRATHMDQIVTDQR